MSGPEPLKVRSAGPALRRKETEEDKVKGNHREMYIDRLDGPRL